MKITMMLLVGAKVMQTKYPNWFEMTAKKNFLPMQQGDVQATSANTDALDAWVGFKPNTAVVDGVARFVAWYREYYQV
jgi:UDP-glucuronate 4-epimerase